MPSASSSVRSVVDLRLTKCFTSTGLADYAAGEEAERSGLACTEGTGVEHLALFGMNRNCGGRQLYLLLNSHRLGLAVVASTIFITSCMLPSPVFSVFSFMPQVLLAQPDHHLPSLSADSNMLRRIEA